MRKNLIYGSVWAVLVVGGPILLGSVYNPLQMSAYSRQALPGAGGAGSREEVYHTSFVLEQTPPGNIVNYIPRLAFADADQALAIAALWGAEGELYEDGERYFIPDPSGVLAVDKFGDHVAYTSDTPPARRDPPEITPDAAAEYASVFMRNRLNFFGYEETVTSFEGGVFEVLFIERLGNLKNYGFPAVVRIDGEGNIFSAEYFFLSYDKLDSFPVKSQADAFYGLPEAASPVDLQKCSLVYCYLDSILQPCYLFEGEYAGGGSFREFVEATVYN